MYHSCTLEEDGTSVTENANRKSLKKHSGGRSQRDDIKIYMLKGYCPRLPECWQPDLHLKNRIGNDPPVGNSLVVPWLGLSLLGPKFYPWLGK